MKKIFFPYTNQPKQLAFRFAEPVRFPFYVNDLKYEWELGADSVTLLIHSEKISSDTPVKSNIYSGGQGLILELKNSRTNTAQSVYIKFAKYGRGIHNITTLDPFSVETLDDYTIDVLDAFDFGLIDKMPLGVIDYFELGELDTFTLGDLSDCFADWLLLNESKASAVMSNFVKASETHMDLDTSSTSLNSNTTVGNLHSGFSITDLKNERYMTLGELDARTLGDIDMMTSIFKILDKVPATLVKSITSVSGGNVKNIIKLKNQVLSLNIQANTANE